MTPPRPAPTARRACLATAVALLVAGAGPAADPDYAAVARQVRDGAVVRTELAGRSNTGQEARSTRPDGILVGFEVGVSKFFDSDWIVALRPLYRTQHGVVVGEAVGEFDPRDHVDHGVRKAGVRTVALRAKPGYAVAAVRLITGLNVDHLSLTYARVTETGLDLQDTYESDAVGRQPERNMRTAATGGRFAVGVAVTVQRRIVYSVGLVHVKDGAPAAPRPPAATQPTPKPAPDAVPTPPGGVTRTIRKERPKPTPPPEPVVVPPATPEPAPAAPPPAPAAETPPAPAAQAAAPVRAEPPKPQEFAAPSWLLPAGVGGGITVLVLGVLLVNNRSRPKARARERDEVEIMDETPPPRRLPRARRVRPAAPPDASTDPADG